MPKHINKIKHFVIVRSGVCSPGKSFEEVYLSARADLFEEYTVKSIAAQTNREFYLIVVTSGLPNLVLDRIRGILKNVNNSAIVKTKSTISNNNFLYCKENYLTQIPDGIFDHSDYVITTRLDDDDMLHPDAIDLIQTHVTDEVDYKFVTFKNGLILQRGIYYKYDYPLSTGGISIGLSLIKNSDAGFNIYGPIHSRVSEYAEKYVVEPETWDLEIVETEDPMWIYNSHRNMDSCKNCDTESDAWFKWLGIKKKQVDYRGPMRGIYERK